MIDTFEQKIQMNHIANRRFPRNEEKKTTIWCEPENFYLPVPVSQSDICFKQMTKNQNRAINLMPIIINNNPNWKLEWREKKTKYDKNKPQEIQIV